MTKWRQYRLPFEEPVELFVTNDETAIREWVQEKDAHARGLHPTAVKSLLATIDALMLELNRGQK